MSVDTARAEPQAWKVKQHCVQGNPNFATCAQAIAIPLYSRKLHMRVRRARTSWVTSLTIFALALGGIVVNHFARRTLPRKDRAICFVSKT